MFGALASGYAWSRVKRFAFTPPGSYIALALVAALMIYGYGRYQYNQGAADKDAEYQTIIKEERERLTEEKRLAEEDAQKRIEELERLASERDDLLQDIIRNSDGRTGSGISRDSVRDLNRIR